MNPPGSSVLRCVFRCEAEQRRTDDTLRGLWRHFRKFGCGFRVGGDFNRASSNKRSSLVTDRRPERRVASWCPTCEAQLVDNYRLPQRRARGGGTATRGSRRLHEFGWFHLCVWCVRVDWYRGSIEQVGDGVASAEQRQLCTRFHRGATLDWGACLTWQNFSRLMKV